MFTLTARNMISIAISTALAASLATIAAAPAIARKGPPTVTISSRVFQDAASKLCMPKTTLGPAAPKDLPATLCQTKAEWEAQGLVFVIK